MIRVFGQQNNQVSYTPFWVSRLALVIRSRGGENGLAGFVLDAASGQPLAGAEVRAWQLGDNNQRSALPPVKSDENGLFRVTTAENRNHLILVRHQDQQLATADNYSTYRNDQRNSRTSARSSSPTVRCIGPARRFNTRASRSAWKRRRTSTNSC